MLRNEEQISTAARAEDLNRAPDHRCLEYYSGISRDREPTGDVYIKEMCVCIYRERQIERFIIRNWLMQL